MAGMMTRSRKTSFPAGRPGNEVRRGPVGFSRRSRHSREATLRRSQSELCKRRPTEQTPMKPPRGGIPESTGTDYIEEYLLTIEIQGLQGDGLQEAEGGKRG